MRVFPVSVLVAGAALLVAGCSGGTTASSPPSTRGTDCGPASSGELVSSTVTRVLTGAQLVRLDADGRVVETAVTGTSGPISPETDPAEPDLSLAGLIGLLPGEATEYGVESSPALDPHGWRSGVTDLNLPAELVWFTGVDRVDGRAKISCGHGGSKSVTFSTWKVPTVGILECGLQPPAGSTAALVLHYCARFKDSSVASG